MPQLAIIIVSYNTCDLLRNCLHSVFCSVTKDAQIIDVSVTVVDNASSDDSAAMVRSEFPQVSIIASAENLGFTKANNLALRSLGFDEVAKADPISNLPDYVLLLNPDTEVTDGALLQMVQALQNSTAAGGCGARLSYGDGSFQHGAFAFPSLAQVVLDLFPLATIRGMHRIYNGALNGRYPQTLWNGAEPFAVDFVLGAALMVKAEVIQKVGLLDEDFFMYCEEMDWCLRIHKAGWQILAVPSARIIHHEGQSSRQVRWKSFSRLWQSRLRFYAKHTDRYSRFERLGILFIVRMGLNWRKQSAKRRFAQGEISGETFAEEVAAYEEILTCSKSLL